MTTIRSRQRGFTLLEVLISVIIFGTGLIGLAGLQAAGQKFNNDAYLRSQAVLYAYDMADRMRANRTGMRDNSYDAIDTSGAYSDPNCMGTTDGCTPAEIAQYDAWRWKLGVEQALPLGQGTVTAGADGQFVITVAWDEDRDGSINGSDDPDFSVELRL